MTPYLTHLAIRGRARRAGEIATATGWMSEMFARQKVLKPLKDYTEGEPEEAVDMAEAMRDWAKKNDVRFNKVEPRPDAE